MRELVVGVDGSEGSRRALLWAADEARLRGDRLVVATVRPSQMVPVSEAGVDEDYVDRVEEAARRGTAGMLERMTAAVADGDLTLTTETLRDSSPYQALIDRAADASALVVGSRGHTGYRRLRLGSVSQHVTVHARCPVVVVPDLEDTHERRDRVLVGVDGSDGARAAVRRAAEEAWLRSSELQLIMVQPPPPAAGVHPPTDAAVEAWMWSGATPPDFEMSGDVQRERDQVVAHWRHEAEARVAAEGRGLDPERRPEKVTTTVIGARHVARALLDAAEWASLLVVGSRGRGGFAGMLLGSVSQHCVRHATAPVMTIPPDAA